MIQIGHKLATERQRRGLTLIDVEEAIKIKSSFLAAIEKGEYYKLPSPTYAQGFVKNYVQFLGLPVRDTMAVFRREFDEEREIKVLPEGFARKQNLPKFRFRIRRRMLLVAVILLLFLGFMLYQYRSAFFNPPLQVTTPKENMVTNRDVVVTGQTDENAVVSINGDIVSVDEEGAFAKKVSVFPGTTQIVVKAKSRSNKETIVTRNIKVTE